MSIFYCLDTGYVFGVITEYYGLRYGIFGVVILETLVVGWVFEASDLVKRRYSYASILSLIVGFWVSLIASVAISVFPLSGYEYLFIPIFGLLFVITIGVSMYFHK